MRLKASEGTTFTMLAEALTHILDFKVQELNINWQPLARRVKERNGLSQQDACIAPQHLTAILVKYANYVMRPRAIYSGATLETWMGPSAFNNRLLGVDPTYEASGNHVTFNASSAWIYTCHRAVTNHV